MSRYDTILTVGSTEFTPLVSAFLTPAALSALAANGSSSVLVQAGASTLPPPYRVGTHTHDSLTLEICKFLPDLEDRVGEATLVVSHAGKLSVSLNFRASLIRLHGRSWINTVVSTTTEVTIGIKTAGTRTRSKRNVDGLASG
ncbi:glycosyltransferase family 1 protein [Pseudohyphozyma bogoriensis]|nr:glycosyltransferase family 1 protein [Pseudohyphozyma bogoriensis]